MHHFPARPSIALCMIVKNEAHVVARCLDSVRPLVTAWVIVDTGSTDGTQDLIRARMRGMPGELYERPWKDFGHNRTEAIELARGKAEYLLVMDADDVLVIPAGFTLPPLVADAYQIRVQDLGTDYWRTQLFRADLDFRYTGVLHEALTSTQPRTKARLEGIVYQRTTAGARSADPHKYEKDAAVLEAALTDEPDNARYAFYLAQSLRDAGQLEKARDAYAKRAAMGGGEEEAWCALLEVAKLGARLGQDDRKVAEEYLRTFERRPSRAEPLCYLAMHLRERGRVAGAYPFARTANEIARPDDALFLDHAVYAWRAKDEFAMAAYAVARYEEALAASAELLASGALPKAARARVEDRVALCREKLDARLGGVTPK